MRIDSVPPDVVAPAPDVGELNSANTIATTSASIFRTAGKTSAWMGFDTLKSRIASNWMSNKSFSPW